MDYYLFQLFNQYALKSPVLDGLAVFFATWSGYLLIAAFLIFLLVGEKERTRKIFAFAAVFLSAAIAWVGFTTLIRILYYRPRPYLIHAVNLLIDKGKEGSFPSGHAAFFFAFSTAVFYYNKKLGIVFLAVSVLMVLARVFAGIHWPSDVLAGAAIGVFSAWLAARFKIFG